MVITVGLTRDGAAVRLTDRFVIGMTNLSEWQLTDLVTDGRLNDR